MSTTRTLDPHRSFDRTYEGLKQHVPPRGGRGVDDAFDRTYEGLKLHQFGQDDSVPQLLTVPMRV